MRYVITYNPETFKPSKEFTFCIKEKLIKFLDSTKIISVDTETTGFDPHLESLISIQIGNKQDQYIIDCKSVKDVSWLKPYLEDKIIIGQNLKFDLKFFYKQGIYPRKIWDTFVAEKVITCGDKLAKAALDVLTLKYCGVTLDKSVRADIKTEGLSERVIIYAADDIMWLEDIMLEQQLTLAKEDLMGAINIENRFTPCLAYIEYCGFKLDEEKWLVKMAKDQDIFDQAKAKLDNWVLSKEKTLKKFIKFGQDLFDPTICNINWSSSKQVIEFFESMGIDCTIIEKGVTKKSVEASNIAKYKDRDIVSLYLDYKKAEKTITTYGQNFLDQINPVTGRLHTNFKQIMDTGRLSSGGKDKSTGEAYINFQNIPADPATRACFVAEEGNILLISDYSGQEQIVLANKAMDQNLLDFYDKGLADMHSFVASKMYPELDGMTLDEIKSKYKDKRQEAKIAGFAINYGGVGQTIAEQLGKSLEDGNRVYTAYFAAFPGLKHYFDIVKQQGLRDGYILFNEVTRRKSYIPFFDTYKRLEAEVKAKGFWDTYRLAKDLGSPAFPDLKHKVSKYFMYKGDIERKSLNYPIQGTSAEATKISCVYIYDYILDNNLFGKVLFTNTIHDENVLECPKNIQEDISKVVGDAMCKSGDIFCKRVPLKAVPEASEYWKK